ncbi:MAG TPA: hypothetical protein VGQ35_06165 [Dongiaceae bacterium]|nr:hypothetical protein [Dongiaceae bacterium]
MKPFLPYLLISDVEHNPFRIRYRLVGTKVVEATGMDFTGRYLDELLPSDEDEPRMDDYAAAYHGRCPVAGRTVISVRSGVRFASHTPGPRHSDVQDWRVRMRFV